MKVSPFARARFSPNIDVNDPWLSENQRHDATNNLVVFSGGDLQVYINTIKVGNLEQFTYTVSTEVAGAYTMGSRNVRAFSTGKRVIVGSMVFAQYDRHAILEGVFNLSKLGIRTYGDLWDPSNNAGIGNVGDALRKQDAVLVSNNTGVRASFKPQYEPSVNASTLQREFNVNLRGISQDTWNQEMASQLRDTARWRAAERIRFMDQLPAFDMTITGVDKNGNAARMAIFGIQVTQESGGFSQTELGNSVGISYLAQSIDHWQAVDMSDSGRWAGLAQIPAV